MPKKNADLVSSKDIEVAKEKTKKGLKSAFAIGCYNSETDNEIGRSKEHAKHMRRTRRQNFARKMNLIDPHYGKKAAGVLAAGTALGLAATTLPGVGAVAGPVVGGGVIASGLAFLETDAHRAVGDHAILDSLLDDRDDNWRTNTTLNGYDGHGDTISEFDRQQMLAWSDSDSEGEDLGNLLPPEMNERHQKTGTPATAPKSTNPIFDSFESDTSQTSATSATSMDFFDSMGSTGEPQKSTVPRPPSPGFGERQTNPHSSSAVQAAGNDYSGKTNLILDNPPVEDDFFASLTLSPTLEPSKKLPSNIPSNISPALGAKIAEKSNQANRAPAQPQAQSAEEDFFANFSGSSSSNNNSGSFFANVAAQIPSTSPKKPAQASDDNDDPFADLYARAKQPAPASNYNALQGMRKF